MFIRRAAPAFVCLPLALAALALPACSGETRAGTGYTVTVTRDVETYLGFPLETVYATALDVMRNEFKYEITREVLDGREGVIRAKTARGYVVSVTTLYETDKVTKIRVFVGPLGDEAAAKDILSRVESRLRAG